MRVSREGSDLGTTFLAVATAQHGKMNIIGDLEKDTEDMKSRLENAIRELAGPNQPMHVVRVQVISRALKIDLNDSYSEPILREDSVI